MLGWAGVLPFAGLVCAEWWPPGAGALVGLQLYAAVILSFLGGVRWGRAMEAGEADRLVWSVVPSLIAWFATWPLSQEWPAVALLTSSAGFLLALRLDLGRAVLAAPAWFRRLCLELTTVVLVCHLLVLLSLLRASG